MIDSILALDWMTRAATIISDSNKITSDILIAEEVEGDFLGKAEKPLSQVRDEHFNEIEEIEQRTTLERVGEETLETLFQTSTGREAS